MSASDTIEVKPKKPHGLAGKGGHKQRVNKVRRDAEELPGVGIVRQARDLEPPPAWGPKDLILRCREESRNNIETLIQMRDDPETPAAVRALSVSMIWDRAYGKAPQMIAIADITPNPGIDVTALSDEELILLEKLLRKASPSANAAFPQSGPLSTQAGEALLATVDDE